MSTSKTDTLYQISPSSYMYEKENKGVRVDPEFVLKELFPNGIADKTYKNNYNISPYHDWSHASSPDRRSQFDRAYRYMGNLLPYFYFLSGSGPLPVSLNRDDYNQFCRRFITINANVGSNPVILHEGVVERQAIDTASPFPYISKFKYDKDALSKGDLVLGSASGNISTRGNGASIRDGSEFRAFLPSSYDTTLHAYRAYRPVSTHALCELDSTIFNNDKDLLVVDAMLIKMIVNIYDKNNLLLYSYMFVHEIGHPGILPTEGNPVTTSGAKFNINRKYRELLGGEVGIKDVDVELSNMARDALNNNIYNRWGLDWGYCRGDWLQMDVFEAPIAHNNNAVIKYPLPYEPNNYNINRPYINNPDTSTDKHKIFKLRCANSYNGDIDGLPIDYIVCIERGLL